MAKVTVVGSGASGVHFALTLLERGHEVTMIDVGHRGPKPPLPEERVSGLKEKLDQPARYFLGRDFQAVVLPDDDAEYYGLPPSKDHVLATPGPTPPLTRGFAPLFSLARGGLAEVWTGGCYPFDDEDLAAFPFGFGDLEPAYGEVARRIGINGCDDDLARFFPLHDGLQPPLDLDEGSHRLLQAYEGARRKLHSEGFFLGRTRVATLSRDLDGRPACSYKGRCLWGCPSRSLYTPLSTLERCLGHPRFRYLSGLEVHSFHADRRRRVTHLIAAEPDGSGRVSLPVDVLGLAAGTLGSSTIFLRSMLEWSGERPRLTGLMDNPQVLVPFVQLRMVGRQFEEESYQYHLLGLGLEGRQGGGHVHGQITTLKTGMIHPVAQAVPSDLRTAAFLTRNLRAALGVVNLNFRDERRADSHLTLGSSAAGSPRLEITYQGPSDRPRLLRQATRRTRRALRRLGCIVPPGMVHVRPMGSSVHYAGTLPMSRNGGAGTSDELCRSRDFENLFLLDGATFPALPAKNSTFTLMANAVRVAQAAF